jgi:hypothetical protein
MSDVYSAHHALTVLTKSYYKLTMVPQSLFQQQLCEIPKDFFIVRKHLCPTSSHIPTKSEQFAKDAQQHPSQLPINSQHRNGSRPTNNTAVPHIPVMFYFWGQTSTLKMWLLALGEGGLPLHSQNHLRELQRPWCQ